MAPPVTRLSKTHQTVFLFRKLEKQCKIIEVSRNVRTARVTDSRVIVRPRRNYSPCGRCFHSSRSVMYCLPSILSHPQLCLALRMRDKQYERLGLNSVQ